MSAKELLVGNMNIVFIGEKGKYDMLHFWNEIVKRVFDTNVSIGRYPKFLLKDVNVTRFGTSDDLAIVGRFVKSTVLSIKQVIEGDELVPRNESHDSAPSSVFVYILKNHVMLFWGEHPGAPSVRAFRTFLFKCINRERKRLVRANLKGKKDLERIEVINAFPPAYVSYIPLPLTQSLESQFSDLTKIYRLNVRQYFQNANLDYGSVLSTNQSLMDAVKSQRIDYSLLGIEDMEGTKNLVVQIAKAGDAKFNVSGKTEEGKKTITNDGVQYSKVLKDIRENLRIEEVAEKIYARYQVDVSSGDIPTITDRNSEDVLRVVEGDE